MWPTNSALTAPGTVGFNGQSPLEFTSALVPGAVIGAIGFPFVLVFRNLLTKAFGAATEVDENIIYPLLGSILLSLASTFYIAIWYRRLVGRAIPLEASAGIGFASLAVSFGLAIGLKNVLGQPSESKITGHVTKSGLKVPAMHQDLKQEY